MTQPDLLQLLKRKCGELGQAEVARRLGYSSTTVSQVLHDKYGGEISAVLQRVEEVFGSTIINCPILGDISLGKCADIRKRPFAATNPTRVSLYRACKTCKRRD